MGIINTGLFDVLGKTQKDFASITLDQIFNITKRSTKPINGRPSKASTIINGDNSLMRKLFQSSSNEEAWYKMKMGGKDGKDEWRLSGARVAGAFVGASTLGRLASGGGIYKDADGNTDIIGIPFI